MNISMSPPGFYVDEAAISAQVICLRQSGHDLYGKTFPLFSEVLGGGYATPATLYGGALWTSIFGDSIESFRSYAAFFGVLTVMGVYFLSLGLFQSAMAALLSSLCLAISPWAFQFSRIAWDPPMAPAFLVLGLAALFWTSEKIFARGIVAGIMLALAAYSYPPVRVQILIALPLCGFLLYHREPSKFFKLMLVTLATLVIGSLPLIWLTLTGEIQGRFNMLSIFSSAYLRDHGGTSVLNVARIFGENILTHLSFKYLFLSGDGNLRHSIQWGGVLSWLDLLALLLFPVLLLQTKIREEIKHRREFCLALILFVAGILPAAMTWESLPHSLRSIGAVPFLAMSSGYVLFIFVSVCKKMSPLIVIVALIFSGFFGYGYFVRYPEISREWFDSSSVQRIQELVQIPGQSESAVRDQVNRDYPTLALSYFLLHSKIKSCEK